MAAAAKAATAGMVAQRAGAGMGFKHHLVPHVKASSKKSGMDDKLDLLMLSLQGVAEDLKTGLSSVRMELKAELKAELGEVKAELGEVNTRTGVLERRLGHQTEMSLRIGVEKMFGRSYAKQFTARSLHDLVVLHDLGNTDRFWRLLTMAKHLGRSLVRTPEELLRALLDRLEANFVGEAGKDHQILLEDIRKAGGGDKEALGQVIEAAEAAKAKSLSGLLTSLQRY